MMATTWWLGLPITSMQLLKLVAWVVRTVHIQAISSHTTCKCHILAPESHQTPTAPPTYVLERRVVDDRAFAVVHRVANDAKQLGRWALPLKAIQLLQLLDGGLPRGALPLCTERCKCEVAAVLGC